MSDTCYQCNKPENGWGYPMRMLNTCNRCGCEVCSWCVAEYDYGGGYDGNGLTQWLCDPCLNPEAYIGPENAMVVYDPRFKFDWSYIGDCERIALVNEFKKLSHVSAAHLEVLREANKLLAA